MHRRFIFIMTICLAVLSIIPGCDRKEAKSVRDDLISEKHQDIRLKPFRVLVVIDYQWTDPQSYSIDFRRVKGEEFIDVVSMLKIWGIPFDVLRLDEQRLQINRFLDGQANPNYGCIIWMADPDKLSGASANFETLRRSVEDYGISLIALFDNIKNRQVADLVGVSYEDVRTMQLGGKGGKFSITGNHYITSGATGLSLPDRKLADSASVPAANGITIRVSESDEDQAAVSVVTGHVLSPAKVLATVGDFPQLVVKDLNRNTKTIWIGGGKDWFRKYPVMRTIFRKSLVYAMGYGIFNDNFDNGFIFIMDDVGCSEHAWSLKWHYPTPRKDTLIKYLIEPLEKYGFMMVQNITPGFANPEKKIIESPWTVNPFMDIFGNWQDYGSTKEGLDEGLRTRGF